MSHWRVASHQPDRVSGFSATLFESVDNPGSYTLAIRGTTNAADLSSDVWGIGALGYAREQIYDLYNYFVRLITPASENVGQWVQTGEMETVHGLEVPRYVYQPDATAGLGVIVDATGLNTDFDARLDVAGHSLGGHLALAFSRLFPEWTSGITTYNAPGIADAAVVDEFFSTFGGSGRYPGNLSQITTSIVAEAGREFISGYNGLPVPELSAFIEDQGLPSMDNPAGNHSIKALTDSLAVQNLLATLDPTLTLSELAPLLEAADSRAQRSLETTLDHLGQLFGLGGTTLIEDRDALYGRIDALMNNPTFQAVAGATRLVPVAALKEAATADSVDGDTYRYALVHLAPFAVTGNAGLYDPAAWAAANFSEEYLHDRGYVLDQLLTRNGLDTAIVPTGQLTWEHYQDLASGIQASTHDFGREVPPGAIRYTFGGPEGEAISGGIRGDRLYGGGGDDVMAGGAGADYLEGNGGDDSLAGGEGADVLVGGAGDDTLEGGKDADLLKGGAGFDTYLYHPGDGTDTIVDDDGRILYDGIALDGGTLVADAPGGTTYRSADGAITYLLLEGATPRLLVHGPAGTLMVDDFQNGDLGIGLTTSAPTPSPTYHLVPGTAFDDKDNDDDPDHEALQGGAGNDQIDGLAGDDELFGRDGNDLLNGDEGRDLLKGGAGDDRLDGGPGDDYLSGGGGSDILDGGDGQNVLRGNGGADLIRGGAGSDIIGGGAADVDVSHDWAVTLQYESDVTRIAGASLSLGAGAGVDLGDDGADLVFAGGGEDLVSGGLGDDSLFGEGGNDTLQGGPGDDLLAGGDGADHLIGDLRFGPGADLPANTSGSDTLLGGAGDDWLEGFHGDDTLYGGAGDDELVGDDALSPQYAGNDFLDGGPGRDLLRGGPGNDRLQGGPGDDELQGDDPGLGLQGNDVLYGGDGNDLLGGLGGDDVLRGEGGDDTLQGDDGNDVLEGGAGADILRGNAGDDVLHGGAGDDVLVGGPGADILLGGAGSDTLVMDRDDTVVVNPGDGEDAVFLEDAAGVVRFGAGSVSYTVTVDQAGGGDVLRVVYGSGDALYLKGGFLAGEVTYAFADATRSLPELLEGAPPLDLLGTDDADRMTGGGQGDYLVAAAGDDTLRGGGGDDVLDGGLGDDTYLFNPGDGRDTITDFNDGPNGDVILLGGGITGADLNFSRLNDDLVIGLAGSGDQLTIGHWFDATGNYQVERLRFGNGSEADLAGLVASQGSLAVAADLSLDGDAGNNTLLGGLGDDRLSGGAGDDTLQGGAGDDWLEGGAGADILAGGTGNDTLLGGAGNDSYRYDPDDGYDTLAESPDAAGSSGDALIFGAGIRPAALALMRRDDDVLVSIEGNYGQLRISGWYAADAARIESFAFADGTVWNLADIESRVAAGPGATAPDGGDLADLLLGTAGNDLIHAGEGDDVAAGRAGNDRIFGGAGNDVIAGGAGNDTLQGDGGDDVFLFNRGDGYDVISAADSGGVDTLSLGGAIAPEDITIELVSTVEGFFARLDVDDGGGNVELGIDVAIGRAPLDRGADPELQPPRFEYTFQSGIRQLQFVSGGGVRLFDLRGAIMAALPAATPYFNIALTAADLLPHEVPGPVVPAGGGAAWDYALTGDVQGGGERMFAAAGDGTVVGAAGDDFIATFEQTLADYERLAPVRIFGGAGDDTIVSRGNDVIHGGAGDDTIVLSSSQATVFGGDGSDRYIVDNPSGVFMIYSNVPPGLDLSGAPADTLNIESYGAGIALGFGSLVIQSSQGGEVHLANFDRNDVYGYRGVGHFVLAGGVEMSYADFVSRGFDIDGDAEDNVLLGSNITDRIHGLGGDDDIDTGEGDDVLVGGAGDDRLAGGVGDDEYRYNAGDGRDVITDAAGSDRLRFGAGITADELSYKPSGKDLQIIISGSDAITITEWRGDGKVEQFVFADGGTMAAPLVGTRYSETLSGGAGEDVIHGLSGNDTLIGLAGNDTLVGGTGNDTLKGGAGDDRFLYANGDGYDRVNGGDGLDTLQGGAADDAIGLVTFSGSNIVEVIDGGAGHNVIRNNDYSNTLDFSATTLLNIAAIEGRGGNDTLIGSADNDTLVGGKGNDTLQGGAGDDLFLYNDGDGYDRVSGGEGWDILQGGAMDDAIGLVRFAGNDTVEVVDGGAGYNVIRNNDYSNTLDFSATTLRNIAAIEGRGGNDTLIGSADNDTLVGGRGNDTLQGGAGDDLFLYNDGDGYDRVSGGAGLDTLQGGAADDAIGLTRFAGNDTVEVVDGGAGYNVIRNNDYSNTLDFSATTLRNIAAIEGRGGNDTLIGSADNDTLVGGRGNDTLKGGAGDDLFLYNDGDGYDRVSGGEGWDILQGGAMDDAIGLVRFAGNDTVEVVGGGAGHNVIRNNDYSNTLDFSATTLLNIAAIEGRGGNDTLIGSADNDTLVGGTGNDTLQGGAGDDLFLYNDGDGYDRVSGGEGWDILQGGAVDDAIGLVRFAGNDTVEVIDGGAGRNVIRNNDYSNTLDFSTTTLLNIAAIEGRGGNDTLIGSAGDDVLDGGAGNDRLVGGAGSDTYRFGRGHGRDTIDDYDAQDAQPEVYGETEDKVLFGNDIAADQLWFSKSGDDLLVDVIGTGDRLAVAKWYAGETNRVDRFATADGAYLLDSQVEQLVSAMAAFAPPAMGEMTLPPVLQDELQPVIAAAWQSVA